MATDDFWGRFRRWRQHRPFWGGLILVLSAAELFVSGNMSINGLELHLGPQGFLSYLLPLILLICGLLSWFTPAQRVFYGIVALLAALYSFVGLNLGGFFVGMVLGIIGGGLVIAWGPPRVRPGAEPGDPAAGGEPNDADPNHPERPADIDQTQVIEVAGHDDRPSGQQIRSATGSAAFSPGFADKPAKSSVVQRLGQSQKAMVIALIPLAVTATVLVAGSTLPASAEECPNDLPSPSASRSTSVTESAAKAKGAPAGRKAAVRAAESTTTSPSATASTTSDSRSSESGNNIIDGFVNFFGGVGNLFGVKNAESPSPSVSPSPSKSASKSKSKSSSKSAYASSSAPTSASAEPDVDSDAVPCLGSRLYGLTADPDGIPLLAEKPGLMEVGSLTMYSSSYDGVVDMPTKTGGSYKALKFSMDKAVSKPFTLTVTEPNNTTTVVTSNKLVTKGSMRFYTPKFKGKLFGFIPVTFTPEHPPPLTLPILWFTNAKIQLAYVRSDDVIGEPLKVVENR